MAQREAVLRVRAEGGDEVARLLDLVERLSVASTRRTRARARSQQQETVDGYRESGRRIVREDQLVTRARLRELALQGEAQKKFQRDFAEAHRQATAMMEREVGKREDLTEKEKRQVESLALAIVASRRRAEQESTRIAVSEEHKRTRAREQRAQAAARGVVGAAGAVAGFAQDAHGQYQNAREQRAEIQSSVIEAVSQVGVTSMEEVNRITDQVIQQAVEHGMDPAQLAQAVGAAQTQFSALGAMENLGGASNAQARSNVYMDAISTAVRGRNLGVNPAEFSRLMGMFTQSGLTPATRERLAAWTVGAQDRGAVETGAVTAQALAPIRQRMAAAASALPANATQEQRAQAMERAYRQAFAELQVFSSLGETVRRSGNAMVGFERALTNQGVLTRMKGNIDAMGDREQRARVRAALFDGQGNLREGLNNPLAFASALMGAGMNDARAITNLFAGTGAGNPMALQSNFRTMLGGLASRDASGKSGADRVNALLAANVALSPEAQAARAALYEGSDRAKLNSEEASRLKALTTNTSEMRNLSNMFARWAARNPLQASALPMAGGVMASIAGFLGIGASSAIVAGSGFAANQRAILEGKDLRGNQLGVGERVLRAGVQYLPGMQLIGAAVGLRDAAKAATDANVVERLLNALPGAISDGIARAPVTIAPHDAVHAATVATTRTATP